MISGTAIVGTVLLALCSLCCCSKETSGAGDGSDNTGDLTVIKFNRSNLLCLESQSFLQKFA